MKLSLKTMQSGSGSLEYVVGGLEDGSSAAIRRDPRRTDSWILLCAQTGSALRAIRRPFQSIGMAIAHLEERMELSGMASHAPRLSRA
jgi:hypothetical protein